jgi:hypothetical protein
MVSEKTTKKTGEMQKRMFLDFPSLLIYIRDDSSGFPVLSIAHAIVNLFGIECLDVR